MARRIKQADTGKLVELQAAANCLDVGSTMLVRIASVTRRDFITERGGVFSRDEWLVIGLGCGNWQERN